MKMDDRCKSARDRQKIGIPVFGDAVHNARHALEAVALACGGQWMGVVKGSKAMFLPGRSRAGIENGNNLRACFFQGIGRQIGIIIIRGDHNPLTGAS